jgi:NAD(P)-dependent dehydrogenase (short-subunit alcohol dehydrogenase family)
MGTLTEKVAFVTGASGWIGHVIAERLVQDGGSVLVSYGKSAGGRHL